MKDAGLAILVAILCILLPVMCVAENKAREDCHSKGGEYYSSRGLQLCVKSGSVIK